MIGLPMVVLLGCTDNQKLEKLERENRELRAKVATLPANASLELQEKCAKQARIEFVAQGWNKERLTGFTNHYNSIVNKCFMEVESHGAASQTPFVPTISRTITDAFEGKGYAEYYWSNNTQKKY